MNQFKLIALLYLFSSYLIASDTSNKLFLDNVNSDKLTSTTSVQNTIIKRSRNVKINFALFSQDQNKSTPLPAQTAAQGSKVTNIELNLFSDANYTMQIKQIKNSKASQTVIWSGTLEGMKYSHSTIAITDNVASGSIRTDDGKFYKIIYKGNDNYQIQEIDQSKLPNNCEAQVPPDSNITSSDSQVLPKSSALLTTDSGDTIDVMILYTSTARVAAGGTAAIESMINSAVETMNTTFSNSNISPRVNLVHIEEVIYTRGENGIATGFDMALDDLTGLEDGYMDHIHLLRDQYKADMVQLYFDNDSSGGLAWIMQDPSASFESYAFSVVHYEWGDGWSTDHEFGHNMGMAHDRDHANADGSFSYSYGYQSPTYAWHTVMSYNCDDSPTGCPRIDYWSNPNIVYSGESTGVPIGEALEADARTTIENNKNIVANWRNENNALQPIALADPVDGSVAEDEVQRYYFANSENLDNTTLFIKLKNLTNDVDLYTKLNIPANTSTYDCRSWNSGTADELCSTMINIDDILYITVHGWEGGEYTLLVDLDTDNDQLLNSEDSDDDNDGVDDTNDAFPLDANEWQDSDGDGIGDNADTDDNNDGVDDAHDAYPTDPEKSEDDSLMFPLCFPDPDKPNETLCITLII